MRELIFASHTREQLKNFAQEGYAVVVPLAATEQHGPHLSVRTDTVICEQVCLEAIRLAGKEAKLLMAPVMSIGCSEHHLEFGGTLSFSSAVYVQMLIDIGRSLHRGGFQKIIFLNGHGGNEWQMQQAAADLAMQYPVWTAAASYWSIAGSALREADPHATWPMPGHAGGFEASMMLALSPDEVRQELAVAEHPVSSSIHSGMPNVFLGRRGLMTGHNGFTDSPVAATRQKGEHYFQVIIEEVAKWLVSSMNHIDTHAQA